MEYADFVARLFKRFPTFDMNLLHAAVGTSTEAGELLDIAKKTWIYNRPVTFDVQMHVIEELGDLMFYIQSACIIMGVTLDDLMIANMEKLKRRYPGIVYTDAAAQLRADKLPGE